MMNFQKHMPCSCSASHLRHPCDLWYGAFVGTISVSLISTILRTLSFLVEHSTWVEGMSFVSCCAATCLKFCVPLAARSCLLIFRPNSVRYGLFLWSWSLFKKSTSFQRVLYSLYLGSWISYVPRTHTLFFSGTSRHMATLLSLVSTAYKISLCAYSKKMLSNIF